MNEQNLKPFKPGEGGRPKGSRNKLGEAFITALHSDWQQHGPGTIERVRTEQPAEYLKIIVRLVPQKLEVEQHDLSGDLDERILDIVREIAADPELGPAAAAIFAESPSTSPFEESNGREQNKKTDQA